MSKSVTTEIAERLAQIDGYVIDMDGVLYRGDAVLPHVQNFLAVLRERSIPFIMATNNSMSTPEQYVTKLGRMGIDIHADQVLTSGLATSAWLKERYPSGTSVYVIGMDALHQAIYGDGYFVPAEVDAELVVSGADFGLTYDKLRIATLAIRRGASYIATNGDFTLPTEEGLIPGAGAIVAALKAATDVTPEVIGKPSVGMLEESASTLGTVPERTVMLGDRLDTDILAGKRAGFPTVLVLTGVSQEIDLAISDVQPDIVIADLSPLVEYYRIH